MNKHIELVKKWLDSPESVTVEELKDASILADMAAEEVAVIAFALDAAAYADTKDADEAEDSYAYALYWVKRYGELTNNVI